MKPLLGPGIFWRNLLVACCTSGPAPALRSARGELCAALELRPPAMNRRFFRVGYVLDAHCLQAVACERVDLGPRQRPRRTAFGFARVSRSGNHEQRAAAADEAPHLGTSPRA